MSQFIVGSLVPGALLDKLVILLPVEEAQLELGLVDVALAEVGAELEEALHVSIFNFLVDEGLCFLADLLGSLYEGWLGFLFGLGLDFGFSDLNRLFRLLELLRLKLSFLNGSF